MDLDTWKEERKQLMEKDVCGGEKNGNTSEWINCFTENRRFLCMWFNLVIRQMLGRGMD